MLREIKAEDARRYNPKNLRVIHQDVFYTLEEFLGECRILVEDGTDAADPEEDDEESPSGLGSFVAVDVDLPQKKPRRSSEELRAAVLEAWDNGNRTISQVMNMVDCTYATAKRYIDGR